MCKCDERTQEDKDREIEERGVRFCRSLAASIIYAHGLLCLTIGKPDPKTDNRVFDVMFAKMYKNDKIGGRWMLDNPDRACDIFKEECEKFKMKLKENHDHGVDMYG